MSEDAQNTGNSSKDSDGVPPKLSTDLPSMKDITTTSKQPHLPVDVLLLTVNDCEFLACYNQLENPYRCCFDSLGYVYFADVAESQEEKVKVALMRCCEGSTGPGSSIITVKNAATVLRPKAVISVGTCSGLNPDKTKLGDVVVSAKLTTYASKVVTSDQEQSTSMRSYVSKRFLNIIKNCADGWQAPLKNPEDREIKVHCHGEFLSGPELVSAEWRRKELVKLHPLAAALEMEGEGIFTAAFDNQIEWLIVKGIADYPGGAGVTAKSWCPSASVMAASLVAHILSDPGVFRTWPHYADPSSDAQKSTQLNPGIKRKRTEDHEGASSDGQSSAQTKSGKLSSSQASQRTEGMTEHHSDSARGNLKGVKEMPSFLAGLKSSFANVANWGDTKAADKDGNKEEGPPVENKDWNLLHSAAEGGDVSIIETMLSRGFDVNSSDSLGTTPLMVAAAKGEVQAVDFLLKGADLSFTTNIGRNLLHAAVEGGNITIVERMFSHNIPIDSSDNDGVTSLMIAASKNDLQIVDFLLRNGADFKIDSRDGYTALMYAAAFAKIQVVNSLLEKGANPLLTREKNGWTLLHFSSLGGSVAIIKTFLSYGLDINIKDNSIMNVTPLFLTIVHNNLEAMKYLLERGADPTLEHNPMKANSLHLALVGGNIAIIDAILSSGFNINIQSSEGVTALMFAACKKPTLVDFLLRKGADPFLKDKFGRTFLHYASQGGDITIIEKCLSCGLDIESIDKEGKTPLMLAASSGSSDAVKFLLQRSASKKTE